MGKKKVKEEIIMPKIKAMPFNYVLITADYLGKDSNIVLADGKKASRVVKDVQTVLAKGPHVTGMEVGDKIMVDTDKVGAKNARIVDVFYKKDTGEILHSDNSKELKEGEAEHSFLITDREILFVLE